MDWDWETKPFLKHFKIIKFKFTLFLIDMFLIDQSGAACIFAYDWWIFINYCLAGPRCRSWGC